MQCRAVCTALHRLPCAAQHPPQLAPPLCLEQVPLLVAPMRSLAHLEVVDWTIDGHVCPEVAWWTWWLKGLLPESVGKVVLEFTHVTQHGYYGTAVHGEGESVEQVLRRMVLAAGSWDCVRGMGAERFEPRQCGVAGSNVHVRYH